MHPSKTPGVSVIVLTYNQPDQLGLVLEGFAQQRSDTPCPFEVIVVNDGGEREKTAAVVDRFADRLAIRLEYVEPASDAMRLNIARNTGLRLARFWRVLLNDGDSIPCADTVAVHASYANGPYVVNSERWLLEPGVVPSVRDIAPDAPLLRGRLRFNNQEPQYIDWFDAHGYSCSFPLHIVQAIGGWWEPMRHHDCNDTELCGRLDRLGLDFIADPRAISTHIYHDRPSTDDENAEARAMQKASREMRTVMRNATAIGSTGCWLDRHPHPFDAMLAQALGQEIVTNHRGARVLDFGAGDGRLVEYLRRCGIDAEGVDGSPETQAASEGRCTTADLSQPLHLFPRDIVTSFEVGEHIPGHLAGAFLDNVTSHARRLAVISWAQPNQGGRGHVNERTPDWLIEQMKGRGFELDDRLTADLQNAAGLGYHQRNTHAFAKTYGVSPLANVAQEVQKADRIKAATTASHLAAPFTPGLGDHPADAAE